MKRFLIVIYISIINFNIFANMTNYNYPKTVIANAETMISRGIQTHDNEKIIDGIIQYYQASRRISNDSIGSVVKKIDELAQQCNDVVAKAVLYNVQANIYNSYFEDNRYFISSKFAVNDSVPKDMREWNSDMFYSCIDSLLKLSLSHSTELARVRCNKYKKVILKGNKADMFRPTMLELLAYNAINIYQESFNPECDDIERYLVSDEEFLKIQIPENTIDGNLKCLALYQLLLQTEEYMSAPYMRTDLNRLNYISEFVENYDSEYFSDDEHSVCQKYKHNYKKMREQYANKDYSCEILIDESEYVSSHFNITTDVEKVYIQLLDTQISKYASYFRTPYLKSLKKFFTKKNIDFAVNSKVNSDMPISIDYTSHNLNEAYYTIKRAEYDVRTEVLSREPNVKYSVVHSDVVKSDKQIPFSYSGKIMLSPLKYGKYQLNVNKEHVLKFTVSDICGYRVMKHNNAQLFAVNGKSGAPMSDVQVELFKYDYKNDTIVDRYIELTNAKGYIELPMNVRKRYFAYMHKGDDKYLSPISMYDSYSGEEYEGDKENISIFTNLGLYRPDDTIKYSGVLYSNTVSTRKTYASVPLLIQVMNMEKSKVVDTLKVVTDKYGRFSGEYKLPQTCLLGQYALEVEKNKCTLGRAYVNVAEYKRPNFSVTIDNPIGTYKIGDSIDVSGKVVTEAGFPIADAKVLVSVVRAHNRWLDFYFNSSPKIVFEQEIQTDEKGTFKFTFKADTDNQGKYFTFDVKAKVTDMSGETQSSQLGIPIGKNSFVIATQLPEIIDKTMPLNLELASLNLSGVDVDAEYECSVYKQIGDNVLNKGSLVLNTHNARGDKNCRLDFSNFNSGRYIVNIKAISADNETIEKEYSIVLYAPTDKTIPIKENLWIPTNSYEEESGAVLNIPFGSSLDSAYVYCCAMVGKNTISEQWIQLHNEMSNFKIEVPQNCKDEIKVLFFNVYDNKPTEKIITVKVKQPSVKLNISATSFRDKLMPGGVEKWTFNVKNADNKPVPSAFVCNMYDSALDLICKWNFQWQPMPLYRGCKLNINRIGETYPNMQHWIYSLNEKHEGYFVENRYAILKDMHNNSDNGSFMLCKDAVYESKENVKTEMSRSTIKYASAGISNKLESPSLSKKSAEEYVEVKESGVREIGSPSAFFYPMLETDDNGNVNVEFTVPQSNTTWKFNAIAFTESLQFQNFMTKVISSKPLMVMPNTPLYLRVGDNANLTAQIQNNSDKATSVEASIEVFDILSGKLIKKNKANYNLAPMQAQVISIDVVIPNDASALGYRVKAKSATYSDGEQNLIPILPSQVLVIESRPFYIHEGKQNTKVEIPSMERKIKNGATSAALTLDYTSNPVWYVAQALPPLQQLKMETCISNVVANLYANSVAHSIATSIPMITAAISQWKESGENGNKLSSLLEKNSELKQLVLSNTPWLLNAKTESDKMNELSNLLNTDRAEGYISKALSHLQKEQQYDGGWSWCPGMHSSPYITMNVVEKLSELVQMKVLSLSDDYKNMLYKAVLYLDGAMLKSHNKASAKVLSDEDVEYMTMRSAYPKSNDDKVLKMQKNILNNIKTQWGECTLLGKAYCSLALDAYGNKSLAKSIIESLRQTAITTHDMGMYWDNLVIDSYNDDAIRIHAHIYKAFNIVDPKQEELDNMRRWLLMQKETQSWGSTNATCNAIYAILSTGTDWLETPPLPTITFGGKRQTLGKVESLEGCVKFTLSGSEINHNSANAKIETNQKQPSWGAMYWQYYDNMDNIEADANSIISISKQLYKVENVAGKEVCTPISQSSLSVGDKVRVNMIIKSSRSLDYVVVNDARAACFEPINQLSSYSCGNGLWYYNEVRKDASNMYLENISKGVHTISYDVIVGRVGRYNSGIATVQSMYSSQAVAHSVGSVINIK